MYLCLAGWALCTVVAMRLPPPAQIHKELYNQPIQVSAQRENFYYIYKGQTVTVKPLADYTIWGLVVSHNDPKAWYRFDITHDKQSLDTRDLCIIWGSNLKQDDYQRISFHSDDWSCNWRYSSDVHTISEEEISNNHLITDSDAIRDIIKKVHIGDQIVIKGRLVNYSEERWDGQFRSTSMTRSDTGNGACEIIFVHDIVVLDSYNELWARTAEMLLDGFFGLAGLRLTLFFFGPDANARARKKKAKPSQSS